MPAEHLNLLWGDFKSAHAFFTSDSPPLFGKIFHFSYHMWRVAFGLSKVKNNQICKKEYNVAIPWLLCAIAYSRLLVPDKTSRLCFILSWHVMFKYQLLCNYYLTLPPEKPLDSNSGVGVRACMSCISVCDSLTSRVELWSSSGVERSICNRTRQAESSHEIPSSSNSNQIYVSDIPLLRLPPFSVQRFSNSA